MEESRMNPARPLDRYLSRMDVWALAFGCMVGWGVFAMPGTTFLPVAGPAGTAIALLTGTAIMLVVAWNFSYLMGRSSITGGVYSFAKEAFGRDHAFLGAWFLCLSYLTIVFLNGTALFFIIRILFSGSAQGGIHYTLAGNVIYLKETLVSAAVLAAIGILFVFAKPLLQRLHMIFAVILFIGVIVTFAFCIPGALADGRLASFGTMGLNPGYGIFSLVIMAPWAFVGFEVTAFDTAHFKFPIKKTWPVLIIAILSAAFAYIGMTMVSVTAVPDGFSSWQEYITGLDSLSGIASVPTFYAARSAMGTAGLVIMALTAVSAIMTGIIGGYRATMRVLSTMAEDHILSEKFSRTSFAVVFIMALSVVLAFLGRNTLNWFVDLTSFGAIVGFGYTSAAAYKIARTEGRRNTMITGIAGAVISIMFGTVQLVPRLAAMEAMSGEAFLLLSFWCLLGFMFYWRTVTKITLTEYSGMSASGVVLFALLVYSAIMWLAKLLSKSETVEEMRYWLTTGGIIMIVIIFAGLVIMLHVQNLVREKHAAAEREKIHAVESSLAKSQFLFNMSHDIRTPMNAIMGYTTLAMGEDDPDRLHEYLKKINGSSEHLLDLINDILEMSRIESGKIELEFLPADLFAVFDGIHDLFAEQMERKGIDFRIYTGQVQHRYVWCDKKNLNRILLNVVSNAYKFTHEGGTITVSLWEVSSPDDSYAGYEIRVQDNGIGMSREFADKIFTAFERERTSTDSGIEGAGLGMSITKSIVDLMGGTIEVLTAPGNGTEIIIRLKLKLATAEEAEEAAASDMAKDTVSAGGAALSDADTETPRSGGTADAGEGAAGPRVDFSTKRLLLVEDNLVNTEIARMILENAGFTVETAENGQIAVNMVSASEPGYYDAILMDIQMPVMDGYAATRAIRQLPDPQLAGIPIMAMTANAFLEDIQASKEAGMQAHIAKPIDVGVLMKTLETVLSEAENGAVRSE